MGAYLGLDVGTTAAKCLLMAEDGRVLATASAGYPLSQPRPGWVEQDAADWLAAIRLAVREALKAAPVPVSAISISTQGDTALITDRAGLPLTPARTWMDTRTAPQIERMRVIPDAEWFAITGATPGAHCTASSVLWWREHAPELRATPWRVAMVADYVTRWLTGEAVVDAPNASRTMLFDIHQRQWSDRLLEALEIERESLPRVQESGTVAGSLRPEAAAELGLEPGITVAVGGHDQTCAAVGCGVVEPGRLMLSCGTAWVVLTAVAAPLPTGAHSLHSYCHALPGGYAVLGAYAGGNLLRWFRDTFYDGPEAGDAAYEAIIAEAEQAELDGQPPMLFLPHFYGRFLPDNCPEARGAWVGLSTSHRRGDMALSLLSGVALQTATAVAELSAWGSPPQEIRMIGGGARSNFWVQLVADAVQRPIVLPAVSEAAAHGAALLALATASQTPLAQVMTQAPVAARTVSPRVSDLPSLIGPFNDLARRLTPFW